MPTTSKEHHRQLSDGTALATDIRWQGHQYGTDRRSHDGGIPAMATAERREQEYKLMLYAFATGSAAAYRCGRGIQRSV